MKLQEICYKVAAKALSPGMIVECMTENFSNILRKGVFYKIKSCHLNDRIMIEGYPSTIFPTRFRKMDDP